MSLLAMTAKIKMGGVLNQDKNIALQSNESVDDVQINMKGGSRGFVASGITPGKVYATADGWSEGAAADTGSLAIGGGMPGSTSSSASVRGKDSVAIGAGATVDTSNAKVDPGLNAFDDANGTAVGVGASVTGIQGTAIGSGAQAKANQTVAVGEQAKANALYGSALGQNSGVEAAYGTAIGGKASVGTGADNSIALGYGSTVFNSDIKDSDKNGVLSVGTGNKERRIIHVANGVEDTDAATVGQIKTLTGIDTTKGAAVQYDDKDKDSITLAGKNGTALKNVSDIEVDGKSFVKAGIFAGDVTGTSSGSLALGDESKVDNSGNSVAIGSKAEVTNAGPATAIGASSKANGMNSVAIGNGASANGQGTIAIGGSVNADQGDYVTVIGAGGTIYGKHATSIGGQTQIFSDNSVAIGYGSSVGANEENTVSFGNSKTQRRLTNIANGINDTDAVTVGQIKEWKGVDVSKGNFVQYDKDGNLNVTKGDSSLTTNNDQSSISHGENSVTANKDGVTIASGKNNIKVDQTGTTITGDTTIKGNLNVDGNLSIGGKTLVTQDILDKVTTDLGSMKLDNTKAKDMTDAVNQNYAASQQNAEDIKATKEHIGVGSDGKFASLTNGASTLTDGINQNTDAIKQNQADIQALGGSVNKLGHEVDSVGAISAALSGLHPLDYDGKSKFQVSAALGTYDGTQAAAIGGFYHANKDVLLSLGASHSFGSDAKTAANVGVTFRVGQGSSDNEKMLPSDNNEKIEMLEEEVQALKAELEAMKKQQK